MLGRSIKSLCCAERNLDTKMGKRLVSEDTPTCMALHVIT